MPEPFDFVAGSTPLLVSIPHAGILVPDDIQSRFTDAAMPLADTDWHVDRLYEFAAALGASVLRATHSRYVIDCNRPPDDSSLYPGQVTSGLVPTETFAGAPIYQPGMAPDSAEITARRQKYWRPYHTRLVEALAELHRVHGYALLFDAHSIPSRVPRLFSGVLQDFNIGTANGTAADPLLANRLYAVCTSASAYTTVLDGRFVGGYITRRYGRPTEHVHAVQLELTQRTYMNEAPPFTFDTNLADRVRPVLRRALDTMLAWGRERYG